MQLSHAKNAPLSFLIALSIAAIPACSDGTGVDGEPRRDGGGDDGGGGDAGDDAGDAGDPCGGDCFASGGTYTSCTCGADDPCGWAGDGICDGYCTEAGLAVEAFDDSADCTGPCTGLCEISDLSVAGGGDPYYLPCLCGVDDPCGWAGNGACDEPGCLGGEDPPVTEMFDDSADCGDAGPGPDGGLGYGK